MGGVARVGGGRGVAARSRDPELDCVVLPPSSSEASQVTASTSSSEAALSGSEARKLRSEGRYLWDPAPARSATLRLAPCRGATRRCRVTVARSRRQVGSPGRGPANTQS